MPLITPVVVEGSPVSAPSAVLTHARAWYEIDEIEKRMDVIEVALEWDR